MSFAQGDLCSGQDGYGRSVTGTASSAGAGGWVILTPFERNEGGVWIQPPAVMVKASTCSVVARGDTLAQSKALRDQEHGGRQATWTVEQRLRERAREDAAGHERER